MVLNGVLTRFDWTEMIKLTDTVKNRGVHEVRLLAHNQPAVNLTLNSKRFSLLSPMLKTKIKRVITLSPKPHPLFLGGVVDMKPLNKMLEEVANKNFFLKVISPDEIKRKIWSYMTE